MARQLRAMGFDARALAGGYNAWSRAYAVEPMVGGAAAAPAAQQPRAVPRTGLALTLAEHPLWQPLWQRVGQAARALRRPFASWRRDE